TGKPQFMVETINARSDSSTATILKIPVNIPASEFIFKKVNDKYQANYSIEFRSRHEDGTTEYQIFDNIIAVLPYAQLTDNTNKSILFPISYAGKPGNYVLDIKVTDKVAKKSDNLQIQATIIRLSPEFDISDPIIIKNLDLINTAQAISQLPPLNPSALSSWNDPVCAFEIYYPDQNKTTSLPITVEYELRNDAKLILKKQLTTASVTTKKDLIAIQINLPEEFNSGLYQLTLTAHIHNPETNKIELTSRTVVKSIRFSSPIPRSLHKMKKMVEPLIYFIPTPYEMMKNFKKAKTAEKKARILRNFWEEQGYDVMRQFYARKEYADKHYGGWRTDMGKVFVKFGPPPAGKDNVRDLRWYFPIPYEVWHYPNYAAAHTFYFFLTDTWYDYKVFIFVDRQRINDFDFGRGGGGYYNELSTHNFHEFNNVTRIY
ncbi:GWxTD domain-containing protein, partial [Patescibacteria group bacterium AH-259-L05]|nr:GWxTD domain-containing protein [Patescibacteria group bacterium AH-259-L05]